MDNLTTSASGPRKTVSNLCSNEYVMVGYRNSLDLNRFMAFRVGDFRFPSLKSLKSHFGVRNLRDLEAELDRLELGSCYAEFQCVANPNDTYTWAAYVWNGKFCVGSSADRMQLEAA